MLLLGVGWGDVGELVFTLVLYISCQQFGGYVKVVGCLWALWTQGRGLLCQLMFTFVLYIICRQLGGYVSFVGSCAKHKHI